VFARIVTAAALSMAARALPGVWGEIAVYAVLGVLPGWIMVDATLPRSAPLVRWALAFAIGPLVTACLGYTLLALGRDVPSATRGLLWAMPVAFLGAGAFIRRAAAGSAPASDVATPAPRAVWALAIALGLAVALVPVLNPFIAVRGDSWTHGAIAYRILDAGVPPEDPRFGAITLHYVWFYNLFAAMVASVRGHSPFGVMVMLNAATAFATVALTAAIALELWRRREAAIGGAVLAIVGFNAGAWLLWPLNLGRALGGEVRGMDEIARELHGIEIGHARIIYSLSAPLAHMTSLLDKLLVGSPMAYGYLLMIVHLWALIRWLQGGGASHLVWIAAAAAGMMLIHGVVGLSIIPVWVGTLLLALLLRTRVAWLPSASRLAAAAGATVLGGLVTTPYMISVASGWASGQSGLQHHYLSPDPWMIWTIVTACGVALWFARRPAIAAWRERSPAIAIVALGLAAMIVFACVVRLPEDNQMKFAYEVFVPAAVLGAMAFWGACAGAARAGRGRALLVGYVLLFPVALTLHGYIADPGRHGDRSMIEQPGEPALEAWIRERTPRDALIVDAGFRDLLMVRGRRPMYLGTPKGPAWAAFPLDQVIERRRVVADLYGPARELDRDVASMARFRRPLYVVFRPEDDGSTAAAWRAVSADRTRFDVVYDADGYRIARLKPEAGT
jgi:hypothetical protein